MRYSIVPWFVCGVLFLACGSSGSGGAEPAAAIGGAPDAGAPSTGGGPASVGGVDAFCHSYFSALADTFERCLPNSLDWALLLNLDLLCERMDAAAAAGRLSYSEADATDCIEAVARLDCSVDMAAAFPATSCGKAAVGAVALGDDCTSVGLFDINECDATAYCASTQSFGCVQVCTAFLQENAACDDSIRCAPGLKCSGKPSTCVPIVKAEVDEPCAGPEGLSCQTGLYCEGSSLTQPGTCQAKKSNGPCTSSTECAPSHFCNNADECAPRKALGDSCTAGENECPLLDQCEAGKCTSRLLDLGESCMPASGELPSCDVSTYCDPVGGVCKAKKSSGEACETLSECGGHQAHCDSTTHLCVACGP